MPQELLEHFQERRLFAFQADRGRSEAFEGVKTRISKSFKEIGQQQPDATPYDVFELLRQGLTMGVRTRSKPFGAFGDDKR